VVVTNSIIVKSVDLDSKSLKVANSNKFIKYFTNAPNCITNNRTNSKIRID